MEDLERFAGRILRAAHPDDPMTPYEAGYDCGMRGPNERNCHFSFFSNPVSAAAWQHGKADARRAREERS